MSDCYPPDSAVQDLFDPLIPFSSVADADNESDRLLDAPAILEHNLVDYEAEESDLTPLNSSDEEAGNINTTPRSIKGTRALRPRVAKRSTSTVERAASSSEAMSLLLPPSPVDQPSCTSEKRNRVQSLGDRISFTTQKQRSKPGPYLSEYRCHQCRNQPRYAFMRCTSSDGSGRSCRKVFCASCIIKRYPEDINFNPQVKEWKCPLCRNTCNCTKCCIKRNESYSSTSHIKIDQDTLLHYASLMPGNSNPEKSLPPKSSESTNRDLKRANRSKSKPVRHPAKNNESTETAKNVGGNPEPTRDTESITRGLADTAAMLEKFGCTSGEYWGAVFSNVDGRRIGAAYIGDQLPDIFLR